MGSGSLRAMRRRFGVSRDDAKRWWRRVLFVAGGLCVGGAAVLMAKLADGAQSLFHVAIAHWPLLPLALTPFGFALSALLTKTVFRGAGGSGIPQVIAARTMDAGSARHDLVSLRVAFGKILCLLLGLLCGGSIGREGPTVQVGASIMNFIGHWTPAIDRSALLLAGAAAGIAAAFNTPLAGIVFGIEELSRSFESRTSGLVIGCVVAAGVTSLGIVGDYNYFGTTAATLPLGRGWIAVLLCGVLGGLGGGLFGLGMLLPRRLPGAIGRWIVDNMIFFAALCGLGVALCGLVASGIHGTGYDEAAALVHGDHVATASFPLAKFAASLLSAVSGIPGGLFAPSLAVGAGIGSSFGPLFPTTLPSALAIIGMVAYLAGVLQTPITSFVIVSEMTQDHAMVIPLMVAALIATAVSRLVNPHGLYHALAEAFVPAASTAVHRSSGAGSA